MVLAVLATLGVLAAEPGEAWQGSTRSQGGAELRLTVVPVGDDLHATLLWPAYERVTIDATIPVVEGCDASMFDAVRSRVDGACRSASARVDSAHPIYEYSSRDHLRCVVGDAHAPMWCRLPFTGWFQLLREAAPTDVVEAARAALMARTQAPAAPVVVPDGWEGEVRWYRAVAWDALELVPKGEGALEGPDGEGSHALYLDGSGRAVLHRVRDEGGDRIADRIEWDGDGRARVRESFDRRGAREVRLLHVDRGQPAVLAWGTAEHVYLLKSLR
jgi:hypothetical protein